MKNVANAVLIAGVPLIFASFAALAPTASIASDLESRVKYNQARTRWSIEDSKRRIEESRKRMQERMDERSRERSSGSHSSSTYGSHASSSSSTSTYGTSSSRTLSSSSAIPTVQIQPAGNGLNWYTNKEFNFRILFKGTPKYSALPSAAGICNSFSYSNNDGATMIGVTELPAEATGSAQINKCLNGACDGAVKASGCVETARYSCSTGGFPGREISATVPGKGKMKSRLYLVRKKLYQITVVGVPSFVDGSYGQQFLKSFALL